MQNTRDFSVFIRNLVCYIFLVPFFINATRGKLSESEPFFNFLKALDPNNVLNISMIGSSPPHPCLVNGVRCNSNDTNVLEIRLENLNLSGMIDADSLCRLQKLRVVSLANNHIRGAIPHSILHCARLVCLNLTNNQLSGRVPKALTKLRYLKHLDLSKNNFTGKKGSLGETVKSCCHVTDAGSNPENNLLCKKQGNVAHNRPCCRARALMHRAALSMLTVSCPENNRLLCGKQGSAAYNRPCGPTLLRNPRIARALMYQGALSTPSKLESNISTIVPTPDPASNNNSSVPGKKPGLKLNHGEMLVGSVLGIGLLLSSLYIAVVKLPKLNEEVKGNQVSPLKHAKSEVQEEQKLKEGDSSELVFFVEEYHERFTLEDLLKAKADLQSESFWSSLYKVKLENNVEYAVKRLKNLQVSSDEFGETLKQISDLKHPNILPLVGYRSASEEKFIIYKYQSNGSLLNLLNDYIAGRKDFSGKLRLDIACGIARALAFMHKNLDGKDAIPHGNLKLSNILLNDQNEPLISEHGISKFFDQNRGFLFSSQGYTAPEKSLSEKGDVYSFGVILLELLTGKSTEISRIDIARWVKSMVREEWTGEVFDKEVRENGHQWAFRLLNIALMCVSRFQENRPSTREILESMEEVMDAHEHEQQQVQVSSASKCCSHGSNQDCCSLHQIIPDTWDSPGSNY